MSKTKNVLLNLYSSMKKIKWFQWFLTSKINFEGQIFALFDTSPHTQFAKFNKFLWICWFLTKNLSNFVAFHWKLHIRYFHSLSPCCLSTLPNQLKLVYWSFEQNSIQSTFDLFPQPAGKETNVQITDYGCPERKYSSVLGQKFTPIPKFLGTYGRSIFCLPHRPNFSDLFELCLHWVSVVYGTNVLSLIYILWLKEEVNDMKNELNFTKIATHYKLQGYLFSKDIWNIILKKKEKM